MQHRDVFRLIDQIAPPHLAASWDRVGFMLGDASMVTTGVVVTVNPSLACAQFAREHGANLVVAHHPLLFRPLKTLDVTREPGRTAAYMAAHDLTCFAAHTNLDSTGCNHELAERLGWPIDRVLQVEGQLGRFKVGVAVPPGRAADVREALWSAGAGADEGYDRAAVTLEATERFRPLLGSDPSRGTTGEDHVGPVERIEVVVEEPHLRGVLAALQAIHPDEAPAFDVVRLHGQDTPTGIGLWGDLEQPTSLEALARRVHEVLAPRSLRIVGDRHRPIRRVAVCSGAGGDLWEACLRNGVDAFLTGEVRYHTALDAAACGLSFIEAGHQATEQPVVDRLVRLLRPSIPAEIPVLAFAEDEPFEVLSW